MRNLYPRQENPQSIRKSFDQAKKQRHNNRNHTTFQKPEYNHQPTYNRFSHHSKTDFRKNRFDRNCYICGKQ